MSETYGKVIPFRKRGEKAPEQNNAKAEPTFKEFAEAVIAKNESEAEKILCLLFSIEAELSKKCIKHYMAEYAKSDEIFMKTMLIRKHLEENETNSLIQLLCECFGVSAPEAIVIIGGLSKRFLSKNA